MKVRNPNFVPPVSRQPLTAGNKTALRAFITNAANTTEFLTFDDLRQVLPAPKRAQVKDGHLHQFLLDEGHEVEP